MKPAIIDGKCRLIGRHNCHQCREDAGWRRSVGTPNICPHPELAYKPQPRPGTELKELLSSFGINAVNCSCIVIASKMNQWGSECRNHLDEIIMAMTKAAKNRKWMKFAPFKKLGARGLVILAIHRAEQKVADKSLVQTHQNC